MASDGIHIDEASGTVLVQGENLIRNLFSDQSAYTVKDFNRIAHAIVKAKGSEFGIVDIGEPDDWCLGTTNEADAHLMMSFLSPEEADFVEAIYTKNDGSEVDDSTTFDALPVVNNTGRTLH